MREGESSQMDAGFLAMSAWREAEVLGYGLEISPLQRLWAGARV